MIPQKRVFSSATRRRRLCRTWTNCYKYTEREGHDVLIPQRRALELLALLQLHLERGRLHEVGRDREVFDGRGQTSDKFAGAAFARARSNTGNVEDAYAVAYVDGEDAVVLAHLRGHEGHDERDRLQRQQTAGRWLGAKMRDARDGELYGKLLVLVLERDDNVAADMGARVAEPQQLRGRQAGFVTDARATESNFSLALVCF
jgi:hypothetical protein